MLIGTRTLQSDYDPDGDSLYLYKAKEKPDSSLEIGNLIIDFAKDGTVIGLEFLNATTTIPPLLAIYAPGILSQDKKCKIDFLEKIRKANVSVNTASDLFIITFMLYSNQQEVKAALMVPIMTKTQVQVARQIAMIA